MRAQEFRPAEEIPQYEYIHVEDSRFATLSCSERVAGRPSILAKCEIQSLACEKQGLQTVLGYAILLCKECLSQTILSGSQ